MELLRLLLGILVFLGLIGVIMTFKDVRRKTWRTSTTIMFLIFVILFDVSFYSDIL